MKKLIAALLAFTMFATVGCGTSGSMGKEASGETFPEFSAEDVNGNAVTQEIFAEKEITMVNIWGITCEPCKEEMPDIEKLSEQLPDNAQVIGIVSDVAIGDTKGLNEAVEILDKAGVTYTNIILDDKLQEYCSQFSVYPHTVFVDSKGNLVGPTIGGVYFDDYVKEMETALDGWKYEP